MKIIKNYKVDKENNKIILYYNNNTSEEREYSVAEEKKTLYAMKENLLNSKNDYEYCKDMLSNDQKATKRFLIAFAISVGVSVGAIVAALSISIWCLFALLFSLNGVFLFKSVYNEYIKSNGKYEDFIKQYEKDIYLIEHATTLTNEKILDPNALNGVSEPTIKYIISANVDEHIPILNLNAVENIPQEDLEIINDNIEKPKVLKLQ